MTLEVVDGTPIEPEAPPPEPEPTLDRFTVTAADKGPSQMSQSIRSNEVEVAWLPYLGPGPMLFARRCDLLLSQLKNNEQSIAVIVHRWADELGMYDEEVVAAKNRLLRFGLGVWEEKGNILKLRRWWQTPVPDAIATPEHKAALLALKDATTR